MSGDERSRNDWLVKMQLKTKPTKIQSVKLVSEQTDSDVTL